MPVDNARPETIAELRKIRAQYNELWNEDDPDDPTYMTVLDLDRVIRVLEDPSRRRGYRPKHTHTNKPTH